MDTILAKEGVTSRVLFDEMKLRMKTLKTISRDANMRAREANIRVNIYANKLSEIGKIIFFESLIGKTLTDQYVYFLKFIENERKNEIKRNRYETPHGLHELSCDHCCNLKID